jgi:hypothetical protein
MVYGAHQMNNLSLKGFIPVLAKQLDMTPAALYERQRALVRAGLLEAGSGRGPGSGVRATPDSVALLLIAVLATGSLSETEGHAKVLANLSSNTGRCPLTGKRRFASALAEVLASPDLAKHIRWVAAARGGTKVFAEIASLEEGKKEVEDWKFSVFSFAKAKSGLIVRAQLSLPFYTIATTLKGAEGPK